MLKALDLDQVIKFDYETWLWEETLRQRVETDKLSSSPRGETAIREQFERDHEKPDPETTSKLCMRPLTRSVQMAIKDAVKLEQSLSDDSIKLTGHSRNRVALDAVSYALLDVENFPGLEIGKKERRATSFNMAVECVPLEVMDRIPDDNVVLGAFAELLEFGEVTLADRGNS